MTLPFDEEEAGPTLEDRVRVVMRDLERRPLPLGALRRLLSVGGLQADLTIRYGFEWLRGFFRDAEDLDRYRAEVHLQAALQVLASMGYLRGLVSKVGQTLGGLPEVVPEMWARVLSRLAWEAPPMHYSLVRDSLVSELGGDPEEVFAAFDRNAFAAASLGQVHRARLRSGEDVAVKVQYPGIARTVQVDLRNLRVLLQPMRLVLDWASFSGLLEDLAESLERETDFRHEAAHQARVRQAFEGHRWIRVPRVFEQYSSARVLVSELFSGDHLEAFLARSPPQDLRDHFGSLLYESQIRMPLAARLLHPDNNAGNFLFADDGTLGLLDFGNMRALDDSEWRAYHGVEQASVACDIDAVVRASAAWMIVPIEQLSQEERALIEDFSRWACAPILRDEPHHFDLEYWREGLDVHGRTARRRLVHFLPMMVHLLRGLYSGRALVTRLGARFNAHRVHREALADHGHRVD